MRKRETLKLPEPTRPINARIVNARDDRPAPYDLAAPYVWAEVVFEVTEDALVPDGKPGRHEEYWWLVTYPAGGTSKTEWLVYSFALVRSTPGAAISTAASPN